jgi:hypothetical protein
MTKTDSTSEPQEVRAIENDEVSSRRELEAALAHCGPDVIRELVKGLRTIRYGSILLTIHEGQLVEISKTVRIRPPSSAERK